jgi:arabinogalactan endo-1,4-beta-galactosidase
MRTSLFFCLLCVTTAMAADPATPPSDPPGDAPRPFFAGADISMLPEIEKGGGVFRSSGEKTDALKLLRDGGCDLFRVRLFVDPDDEFNNKNYGATQDLEYVVALSRRIKASSAALLLDIHYSDTWADPGKQFKPAAWKGLDFDALERQVHDYTAAVLKQLRDAGATPDMVQIGNEIAGGMLWPDGKVLGAKKDDEARQWQRFARLLNAGARAVREASSPANPIRVVIHIHGGGKAGLPKWFFGKLDENSVDYDVIALSFYPAWDDTFDALKQNMAEVIEARGKDILIAETSYPWRPMEGHEKKPAMRWPQTREGQQSFVRDLTEAIRSAPSNRGIGFVWWYPEAIPVPSRHIWRNGAEALFDEKGEALPALDAFRNASRRGRT